MSSIFTSSRTGIRPTPPQHAASPQQRAVRAVWAMVAATLLVSALVVGTRWAAGDGFKRALHSSAVLNARMLLAPAINDSWGAMAAALRRVHEPGAASLYQRTLNVDHCKFQYPPSSLLPLELVGAPPGPVDCGAAVGADFHYGNWPAKFWIDWAMRLALIATVLVSVQIVREHLEARSGPIPAATSAWLWAGGLAAGLTYYPLVHAYHLGQVQVFLNALLTLALWLMCRSASVAAGVLIGLCCLVKPQYALLLGWALLRRDLRFAAALLLVAGIGHAIAVQRYGLAVHLQYLEFLSGLSRVGEAYWANQSVNGILNRLLSTADPTRFSATEFPTPNEIVRWGTLLSSLAIIGVALWMPVRARSARAHAVDFGAMVAALTLASPVAWQHHYGSFFGLFALVLGLLLVDRNVKPLALAVAAAAYLAMANAMLREDLLFGSPALGLLGSHLWLGAIALFGLLLWLRRTADDDAPSARSHM